MKTKSRRFCFVKNWAQKVSKLLGSICLMVALVLGVFLLSQNVQAADGINKQLSYYGVLKYSNGTVVPDGSFDIVFKIYSASSGGSALWTGNHTAANGNAVTVSDGNFTALLGSGSGNTMSLDFTDDTYYIGVTVGLDSEMSPRQRLGAAPYTFNSDMVDGTNILKTTGNPEGSEIGSVGDIALDTTNSKMYIKISGTSTDTGWSELISSGSVSSLSDLSDITLSSPAAGSLLVLNGSGQWTNMAASGDVTVNSTGVITIAPNAVALGTDTTGNYISSIVNGSGITGADGGSEGAALTLSLDIDGLSSISSIAMDDYIPIYDTSSGGNTKISRNDFLAPVLGALNYQGTWDAGATVEPEICNLSNKGHYFVVSTVGNGYDQNDWAVCNETSWDKLTSTAAVASVFGRTGAVTANAGDYTAAKITNTGSGNISSTTVQAAINELDTEKQALNALLTSISGLTPSDGNFLVGDGTTFTTENGDTARISLGLGSTNTPTFAGLLINGDTITDLTGAGLEVNSNILRLADSGVTTAKLADASVTLSKLASNSCASGQVMKYDGSAWACAIDNNGAADAGDMTTTNAAITITGGTGAVIGTGTTINIATADTDNDGLLSFADWNTFNTKEGAIAAGTTGQYFRGDKTWAVLDKTAVGIAKLSDIDAPAYTGNAGKVLTVNDTADGLTWADSLASSLADGKILVGNASGQATAITLTGDVTISNAGVTAIGADAVALGTDTTGNYVAGATADSGLVLTGTEGGTLGIQLNGTTLSLGATGISLNLANANTWTALQTYNNGITMGTGSILNANSNKITNLDTPTDANDAANKAYIDSFVSGITWQNPIINLTTGAAPGSPTTGDRYVLQTGATGFGACTENQIAQWDGSAWACSTPSAGWTAYASTPTTNYNFNGTNWVSLGSTVNHSTLAGLQGGQASEYYHLTVADYGYLTHGDSQLADLLTSTSPTFAGLTVTGAISAATSVDTVNGLIVNAGSLSAVTGLAMASGDYAQTGTGTFSTGTGAVSLNGDTTIATDKNFSQDGAGTFSTGTGAVSLNGETTVASGKNVTLADNTGEMRYGDADGSNYVGFKAPDTVATDTVWTLPGADGGSGQVLSTNGTGGLSWVSQAAGGDTTTTIAYSEDITAGDLVEIINDGGTAKAKKIVQQIAGTSTGIASMGTYSTVGSKGENMLAAQALDIDKVIVTYRNSANAVMVRVGQVTDSDVTWGPEAALATGAPVDIAVLSPSSAVIMANNGSTFDSLVAVSISGLTPTVGAPISYNVWATYYSAHIAPITSNKFLYCVAGASTEGTNCGTFTVSGTSITNDNNRQGLAMSVDNMGPYAFNRHTVAVSNSGTRFISSSADNGTYGVQAGSYNSSTNAITWGAHNYALTTYSTNVSAIPYDDNKFIVASQGSNIIKVRVVDVTNASSIVTGSEATVYTDSASSQNVSIALVSDNVLAVSFQPYNSPNKYIKFATVSGNTISSFSGQTTLTTTGGTLYTTGDNRRPTDTLVSLNGGKIVNIVYNTGTSNWEANVLQMGASTSYNYANTYGIAQSTATADQNGTIVLVGQKSTVHSGLVSGTIYYIQENGTIGTTVTSYPIGRAIDSTTLYMSTALSAASGGAQAITIESQPSDKIINNNGLTFVSTKEPQNGLDANNLWFYTNGSARMMIAENGNIGIGTNAPSSALHIEKNFSSGATILTAYDNAVSAGNSMEILAFGGLNSGGAFEAYERGQLTMTISGYNSYITLGSESRPDMLSMRTGGGVGIGKIGSGSYGLDVSGNVRVGSGTIGCIQDADGSVLAGTCSSDARLKDVGLEMNSALAKVMGLRPTYYRWKDADGQGEEHLGLIAQEVQGIAPELVHISEETGLLAVNYSDLPLYLVKALQEQQSIIETNIEMVTALDMRTINVVSVSDGSDGSEPETIFKGLVIADTLRANKIEGVNFATITQLDETENELVKYGETLNDITEALASLKAKMEGGKMSLSLKGLDVSGAVVFSGPVKFADMATFEKGAEFVGKVTFDGDSAGFATIAVGKSSVDVKFDKEYASTPVIILTLRSKTNLDWYRVTDESEKGFTIEISPEKSKDINFAWMAIVAKGASSEEIVDEPQTEVTENSVENDLINLETSEEIVDGDEAETEITEDIIETEFEVSSEDNGM